MKEKVSNINNFVAKSKNLLLDFFATIQKSHNSKEDLEFIKKSLNNFLEQFDKRGETHDKKKLNSSFINLYLSKLILERYPGYSKRKIVKIQTIIKKFLNFLTLHNVLQQNNTQEIYRGLYNKTMLKKVIDNNLNLIHQDMMNEISDKFIYIGKNFSEIINDDDNMSEALEFFTNKPEKLIVKAIFIAFNVMNNIENFLNLIIFINFFLKLDILPAMVIKRLKSTLNKKVVDYRLLMLYRTFFYAGYNLRLSFNELLDELGVNLGSYQEHLSKYHDILVKKIDNIKNYLNGAKNSKYLFDIEHEIDLIRPFNKNVPYLKENNSSFSKLPIGINLNIQKHLDFLKKVSQSNKLTDKFLESSFEDFNIYFSNIIDKKLVDKAYTFYYEGKYQKATINLNRLLKRQPRSAIVYYLKGKILREQGQTYNALKFLLKSLEIDPFFIEIYMDFSQILLMEGYFYSSYVITSELFQFLPLDFDLIIQMAYNSYQLLKPFKPYLKLAGQLEPERLINFLKRYWLSERIKPKDKLKNINISKKTFEVIGKLADLVVENSLKALKSKSSTYYEDLVKEFKIKLENPLYFFPKKKDHILKNWFIYELTFNISDAFFMDYYDNLQGFSNLILTDDFLKFCIKISKEIFTILMSYEMNQKLKSISKDFLIRRITEIYKDPFYHLITFLILKDDFFDIIYNTSMNLIKTCKNCPTNCLDEPLKKCLMFLKDYSYF
ncbi:MAG: tetratricopeptide repeat protein [Promethearchaeota archaeon]